MFALAMLNYDNPFIPTIIFFIIIIAIQVLSLFRFLDKSREGLLTFLQAIKSRDFSQSYPTDTPNDEQNKVNYEFNEIMEQFNTIKKEREADFQYLKNIVQHVGIGLITFGNNGDVQISNTASKNLLKFKHIDNIRELSSLSEELVDIFFRLKTGGRDLIKLNIQGDIVQLAVYAIELTLRNEEFKLISVQNIQSELEEKEMEAWQNLVRVLTHEIMNSVTPISSLANTMEEEMKVQLQNGKGQKTITMEDAEDLHLAISTIQKRSVGLIRFVQDFRNLTHIPKPKLDVVKLRPMIDQISLLMKSEIESQGVNLNILIDPEDMTINADKELIEQVLINLIKNATQAFDEQTNRLVEVNAHFNDKGRPLILVKDNGNGIDEEALQKIFIPFFTTKKSGSGIGLSLSKQIMRQHQGVLAVKSTIDEGTEFELRF
jgi:nitrogen fixation/metabolism regulation signal transduction histidine kinase